MVTYRDMQIGMERVRDARRADARRRAAAAAQADRSDARHPIAALAGWLGRRFQKSPAQPVRTIIIAVRAE